MSKEDTKNMPVGSIVSTIKKIHDEGWICCDGKEYENINNMYGELIDMGIGELNITTNIYKVPNYQNMELVSRNEITAVQEVRLLENYHYYDNDELKKNRNEHIYSQYKRDSDAWFTGIINYFIKNRTLINDNKVEVFWFIKYRN